MPFVINDTKTFVLVPTKDGTTWDITGATVTLYLRKPSGVILEKSATVASSGTSASYVDSSSSLTVEGSWARWWKVSQTVSSVTTTLTSTPIPFTVLSV